MSVQPLIAQNQFVRKSLLSVRQPTPIWFERVRHKLGLPFWAGAVVIVLLPFVVLDFLSSYLVGSLEYYYTQEITQYASVVPFSILEYYGAAYCFSRIEHLQSYCQSLGVAQEVELDMGSLASVKRIAILAAALSSVFIPIYVIFGTQKLSLAQNAVSLTVPWAFFFFVLATFVYVYSYSMYLIYRMGNLPLRLKSFTEDRTLGLRPFGAISLRLTLVYLGVVVLALVSTTQQPSGAGLAGPGAFYLALGFTGLASASLILFILPLAGLHRKLVEAKRAELSWLRPRRSNIVEMMRASGDRGFEVDLLTEYNRVGQVERDVQQVHNWPLDISILARLLAVILSVTAIILSRVIANAFHF